MRTVPDSLRAVCKRPGSAVALSAILGGAVAVVSAVFAICDSVLFERLPYRDPASVVHLAAPFSFLQTRPELAEQVRRVAFESALFSERARAHPIWIVQPGGETAVAWPLRAAAVSPSLFGLLGVQPFLGRLFDENDVDARPRRLLLAYDLWRERFGSNPDVIGSVVDIPDTLDEQPWLLVGVLPKGVAFPQNSNAWVPLVPENERPAFTPDFARLAPGVSAATIAAELPSVAVTPLDHYVRPAKARSLVFLLISTVMLLLIAWMHASMMFTSRARSRLHEAGVRLALGATAADLRRQFAAEGWWLAIGAGVVGMIGTAILTPVIASSGSSGPAGTACRASRARRCMRFS